MEKRWEHLALLGNTLDTMRNNGVPPCGLVNELDKGIRELYTYFPEPENYQFDAGPNTPEEAVWEFLRMLENVLGEVKCPKG